MAEQAVSRKQSANAIRALSMDAVQKAKSGHPGAPMGMADIAQVLWCDFLKHNPGDPKWFNRDRFVLSNGHGSMLIYSLLHLTGYDLSNEDLQQFRQFDSKTPGHPEYGYTPGVETTTGPLGQGLANGVGMAIAEKTLAAQFNREGHEVIDHNTYVFAGDGCLMEGISQEAITLAGHLKLSNLIVLFDDNAVTIDGGTDMSDNTDQCARFEASDWVTRRVDGHDAADVEAALAWAQDQQKPVMLSVKTIIGYGAKRAGTGPAHGGPYGPEEIETVRESIGWPHAPFDVPTEIEDAWKTAGRRAADEYAAWHSRLGASSDKAAFEAAMAGAIPENLSSIIAAHKKSVIEGGKDDATRKWSGAVLEPLTEAIPEMIGGSADLTGSNNTKTSHTAPLSSSNWAGRYVHYGIREHAMAAAMNGMSLHGGVIPYSGTFLVFADYSRGAIRLGALMGERVIHVMTHDSIGLGEDGPTHQPVEHVASLRAMPNMTVFRPCDGVETAECWELALRNTTGPSTMALTRQKVKSARSVHTDENVSAKGGYVLSDADDAKAVLIATGSEVEIAMAAQVALAEKGVAVRVVSMPSMDLFEQQSEAYQTETLGGDLPRIAVEAGVRFGWDRWIGHDGGFVGMSSFGASAPYQDLYNHFNITADAVIAEVEKRI